MALFSGNIFERDGNTYIGYYIFYVWSKSPFTLSIFDLGENFNHYDCLYCCGYQLAIFSWENQLVIFSLSE